MAITNLAAATSVNSMLRSNSIIVEIGGSIRRITLDKLMDAINSEQEGILRQVAWGQELMEGQTSTNWIAGRVGNRLMYQEYESLCGR